MTGSAYPKKVPCTPPPGLAERARGATGYSTASPMKVCGRSAISPMCGPPFAARTGRTTTRSTGVSPGRWSRMHLQTPIVLVQDYHFALLPRMIREMLPGAIVITFWHIPWPNAEAFSICPWREELVDGLLGSSVLGFQTQFHCNNFFDTVDRLLEARVAATRSPSRIAASHRGEALSDLRSSGPRRFRLPVRRWNKATPRCANGTSCRLPMPSPVEWIVSITPRESKSVLRRWNGCSRRIRGGSAGSP